MRFFDITCNIICFFIIIIFSKRTNRQSQPYFIHIIFLMDIRIREAYVFPCIHDLPESEADVIAEADHP